MTPGPNGWEVRLFAEVGTGEPFVARMIGLSELVDATSCQNGEAIKAAILSLLTESLISAFGRLREIHQFATRPGAAEVDKLRAYDDFYRSVWAAYRDRMITVAELIGFNIGFLFLLDDGDFERQAERFRNDHNLHPEFVTMLRGERQSWQKRLQDFRNKYLEHQQKERAEFLDLYRPESAQLVFENVWHAIEEVIAHLLEQKFLLGGKLTEIPVAQFCLFSP